jgi:hypothetical protein
MRSTKVKTPNQIAAVRELRKSGMPIRGIVRHTRISINTVRKIIRETSGYETDKFSKTWKRGAFHAKQISNEIDGSPLHLQGNTVNGYPRVQSKSGVRQSIHIHLAKQLFIQINKEWLKGFTVHHIDNSRLNFELSNLSVFTNPGEHLLHHKQMEVCMYNFLLNHDLLDDFYTIYPELKLVSLKQIHQHSKGEETDALDTSSL